MCSNSRRGRHQHMPASTVGASRAPWQGTEKLDNLAKSIKEARREALPKSHLYLALWNKPKSYLSSSIGSPGGGTPMGAASRWRMAAHASGRLPAEGEIAKAELSKSSPSSKRASMGERSFWGECSFLPRSPRKQRPSVTRPSAASASSESDPV